MRIQDRHLHAVSLYCPIRASHFWWILYSIIYAKKQACLSVTHHLPFEIEHPKEFRAINRKIAVGFVIYGELLKKVFRVKLYWENSPVLNVGSWDLKYGQTDWTSVPLFIDLCVDTGHIMLGAKNKTDARRRIAFLFHSRGRQIKHIHLHENDFKSDLHLKPFKRSRLKRVINRKIFATIVVHRSYIFEDPA